LFGYLGVSLIKLVCLSLLELMMSSIIFQCLILLKFVYISLILVSLPLFGCFVCLLCVRWSYDVCVIREQLIMQMILARSRPSRGWDELGSLLSFV